MELLDMKDLKSFEGNLVRVGLPPPAPISNFPIFARPIRPREARKGMETLARREAAGNPIFPYAAAQSAAREMASKKPKSFIVERVMGIEDFARRPSGICPKGPRGVDSHPYTRKLKILPEGVFSSFGAGDGNRTHVP